MPTGYTADIKDGIDFKTFAMNCARAFGACVTLRDEPGCGESIPDEFAPSDYHEKALRKARADLIELDAMTASEREQAAAQAHEEAESRRAQRLSDMRQQKTAYVAMLAKVNAWSPPTTDHENLQNFMRDQITQSISFDCNESYYSSQIVRLDGESWAAERRDQINRDISYHKREHEEEVSRAAQRTLWVKALRASLAEGEAP